MKSKTSCFNKTIFLKNITHYWPIWVMFTLWNLFILPFMIFNESQRYKYITDLTQQEIAQSRSSDILSIVGVYMNPAALFFFAVIVVMAVFSYLYHARSAYALHAFPVTRLELFFTNYFSGLLFLLAPQAAGFLMGILVSAVCGYTSMNYLLLGLLYAWGISFILYSITVFIAMFTGQLLAVPIFALILNLLYVGCKVLAAIIMSQISYGIPMDFHGGKLDALSPLYYLGSHVRLKYDESGAAVGIAGGNVVAIYALVSVLFVAGAYLIYKVRHMETAGSLISIWWICPVFRWGAGFTGGGFLGALFCELLGFSSGWAVFASALVFGVLFGGICFFAAQMFLEKGFRVFHKKRFVECVAFLLVFAGIYTVIELDLFGIERKMPEETEIAKAFVEGYTPVGGSEADLTEQILDLHRQIIDSKKEFENYAPESNDMYYLGVKYVLKNGSVLKRSYKIPWEKEMRNEENSAQKKLIDITTSPDAYWKELFGVKKQQIQATRCEIDLYDEKGVRKDYVFPQGDMEKVFQAFLADLEEGNLKQYLTNRYFYDISQNTAYYNSLKLDVVGEEEIIPVSAEYYSTNILNGTHPKSASANLMFDSNCVNLIRALIDTGVIESEADLITMEKYYELQDKNSVEFEE